MSQFANPARFLKLCAAAMPWLVTLAVASTVSGLWYGLLGSPADYQQGETVRIMYVHVPSAWMALFIYANVAIASATALIWKHPLADLIAKAASPVGAGFTLVCLVTGALWGKPMWGTWWAWDARLTSMLLFPVLCFGHPAPAGAPAMPPPPRMRGAFTARYLVRLILRLPAGVAGARIHRPALAHGLQGA